ncbi:DUF6082 family protein [Streptomonospora litoralis]|uniref:DUF6082 family protein n=1 Tax=Streptomonospora litoralis TaxID=2498135 RepID=UPI0010368262|nr:DUF6082 family protein [Streptomonospora litoralis]
MVLVLVVVAVVGLVGLSPLALGLVRGISGDWEGLSVVGQTYGAASALLAGLALVGVVATLVVQARETRMARELALRDSNSELLRMAMENEEYAECWGANMSATGSKAQRQSMYTNMIVSQWEMAFDSRAVNDEHVRTLARNLFVGPVGWEYWNRVREVRLHTAGTRRSRRFHRILDEEFQRAPEPPAAPAAGSGRRRLGGGRGERSNRVSGAPAAASVLTGLVGFGAGALVARLLKRLRRRAA